MRGISAVLFFRNRQWEELYVRRLNELGLTVNDNKAEKPKVLLKSDLIMADLDLSARQLSFILRKEVAFKSVAIITSADLTAKKIPFLRHVKGVIVANDTSTRLLRSTVEDVLSGNEVVPDSVFQALVELNLRLAEKVEVVRMREGNGFLAELTPREHQVACLVGQDLDNKQIAKRLHVSYNTVKNHVHSILSKKGFTSRQQIIELAFELGWVERTLRFIA